jgi:hypothetical protein
MSSPARKSPTTGSSSICSPTRAPAARDRKIRQSVCAVCDRPARPGSAIVLSFGGGGRVHRAGRCPAVAQKSAARGISPQTGGTAYPPLAGLTGERDPRETNGADTSRAIPGASS